MQRIVFLLAIALAYGPMVQQAFPANDVFVEDAARNWLVSPSTEPKNIVVLLNPDVPAELLPNLERSAANHRKLIQLMQSSTLSSWRSTLALMKSAAPEPEETQTLWIAGGVSIQGAEKNTVRTLLSTPNVRGVFLDSPSKLGLGPTPIQPSGPFAPGLEKIGVSSLRAKYPTILGTGVRIGLIDTGIDASHPDLQKKVVLFKDFAGPSTIPVDFVGHGTHVGGTIAGGATSGTAIGVAPGAELVVAKMADKDGNAFLSSILLAMQWMADPDGDPSTVSDVPRVVNNSWAYPFHAGDYSPLYAAVVAWRKLGILPVFAAGNGGKKFIETPAVFPASFAVGASTSDDKVAYDSNQGPGTISLFDTLVYLFKPQLVAPGVDVVSSLPGGLYAKANGTSMSCPHVTGTAALLFQINSEFSAEKVISILKETADDLETPGFDYASGYGRVNALKAVERALSISPRN